MPVASRVDLYAAIRRDARAPECRAVRSNASTVWGIAPYPGRWGSVWPQHRKEYAPRPSKLDPFKTAVDAILLADLDAPRKQRHTTIGDCSTITR